MPKRTCSVDGCDRRHASKGFCSLHYGRLTRTGDPQADLPIGTHLRAGGVCKINGCDRPRLSSDWCSAHYERWKRHGDQLGGDTFRKPKRERTKCSVPDCGRESKTVDLCPMHYQRQRLNGTTDLIGKPLCSVDDCAKQSFKEGFCRAHWERWKEFGDPAIYRRCIIDGCERFAPSGKRGWCLMHYTRWSKHGDVGDAARRFFEPPREAADGHQWCMTCRAELPLKDFQRNGMTVNGYARSCRDCARDRRVADDYGISPAMYRSLLDEQGGVCRICRKPETGRHQSGTLRRLAVDHDHKCCPGKKSCGKCVRGLLCGRCNSAIGLIDESLAVLESMALYLKRELVPWIEPTEPGEQGALWGNAA